MVDRSQLIPDQTSRRAGGDAVGYRRVIIPAQVEFQWKQMSFVNSNSKHLKVCVSERACLPNSAPIASPAVCGCENAAMALNTSGAPFPKARNVTPSTHTAVKVE